MDQSSITLRSRCFQDLWLPDRERDEHPPEISATSFAELKNEQIDEHHDIVFIWDIDDITMLSKYLLSIVEQQRRSWGPLLVKFLDCIANMNSNNQNHEAVVDIPDDFRQFYKKISEGLLHRETMISYELIEKCGMSEQAHELCEAVGRYQLTFTQCWFCVERCLNLVKKLSSSIEPKKKYANVGISEDGVMVGASKLLASGFASAIPIDNVYSMIGATERSVLETIQSRFGAECRLIYITSNPQKSSASEELQIPVWPVSGRGDPEWLFYAIQRACY